MTDTAGDGWDGAELIMTYCDGTVFGTYTMSATDGQSKDISVCVPQAGRINVTAGNSPSQVGWKLLEDGNIYFEGGAPTELSGGCEDSPPEEESPPGSTVPPEESPPEDMAKVVVSVTPDNYPAENSFELTGGHSHDFSNADKGNTLTFEYQVVPNADLVFTMKDSWGDGMCCSHGNGNYKVWCAYDDGSTEVVAEGGVFAGDEESTEFQCNAFAVGP